MIKYDIYFDGACRNVKGSRNEPFGVGVAVFSNEVDYLEDFSKHIHYPSGGTNNIAEWEAFKQALLVCNDLRDITILMGYECKFTIFSDSEIVVNQFYGKYQIREESFQKYYDECKELFDYLQISELKHILRHLNTKADELSKLGLQNK